MFASFLLGFIDVAPRKSSRAGVASFAVPGDHDPSLSASPGSGPMNFS